MKYGPFVWLPFALVLVVPYEARAETEDGTNVPEDRAPSDLDIDLQAGLYATPTGGGVSTALLVLHRRQTLVIGGIAETGAAIFDNAATSSVAPWRARRTSSTS